MSRARIIANVGQYAFSRGSNENIIINGEFRVAQRGTTFTSPATSTFVADRWQYGKQGAGVVTASRLANDTTSVPFYYYEHFAVTTADTSIAADDRQTLYYTIEGTDVANLNFGLSSAETLTLSFWHSHTKTGTYCVAFRNGAADRSYVAEYTQSVSDTWEQATVTFVGDTTGTWTKDITLGLSVTFTFACGSTFQTTAGSWAAGNFIATSSQVNGVDSTSNSCRIGNVKLEVGSVATPYIPRPIEQELALCQRYYEKSYNIDVAPGTVNAQGSSRLYLNGLVNANHDAGIDVHYAVMKRTTPTVTMYSPQTGASGTFYELATASNWTANVSTSGHAGFLWFGTIGGVAKTQINIEAQWTADAEL